MSIVVNEHKYNEMKRAYDFVNHIKDHLNKMPDLKDTRVQCKICGKFIDEITDE